MSRGAAQRGSSAPSVSASSTATVRAQRRRQCKTNAICLSFPATPTGRWPKRCARSSASASGKALVSALLRRRSAGRDRGERAPAGSVRDPADVRAERGEPGGIAGADRRAQARIGVQRDRGGAVFRIRPPGSSPALGAGADHGQGRGEDVQCGRHRPGPDRRPACRPDPGLLRLAGGQCVRVAAAARRHLARAWHRQPDRGLAGRRWRGARSRNRQAPRRRRPGDHRQAPSARQRRHRDEHHRRRRGQDLRAGRRHRRHRRAPCAPLPRH